MMEELNWFLSGLDWRGVHTFISLTGALLAVYVMQKTRYEAEDRNDPTWIRGIRTFVLGTLALCFLWSLTYGYDLQWNPWPPDVARAAVVDLLLALRAAAIVLRVRRTGRYRDAPSNLATRTRPYR